MTRRPVQPATLCIHGGRRPGPGDPAVVMPVHQSSTFVPGEEDWRLVEEGRVAESRFYSRYGNPSVAAVERRLALLEGADEVRLFASGNAAMHAAVMALALPGGRVVASDRLYGGTRAILTGALAAAGGSAVFVDLDDAAALEAALRPGASVVLCESIANPTLEVADLPRLATLARAAGARLLVDATYATPLLQRPLEHGADLVVHSATKFLGGHSDLLAGAVASSGELAPLLDRQRMVAGAVLDPFAAFLLDRGLRTLAVRMRAHCEGASRVARFLAAHPRITRVLHPSLEDFPHHDRARTLLSGPGAVVLAALDGDEADAAGLLERLELAVPAPSLGGVETLVSQPCRTSHAGMSAEERAAAGILPGAFRLSVGIEDPEDLCADLAAALEGA
jgi:cystathionine beta-lyase/cystathionine gamma-synthase